MSTSTVGTSTWVEVASGCNGKMVFMSPLCLIVDVLPKCHPSSSFIFKALMESSLVLVGMSINEVNCDHYCVDKGYMPSLFVSYCWLLTPPIPHLCCLSTLYILHGTELAL